MRSSRKKVIITVEKGGGKRFGVTERQPKKTKNWPLSKGNDFYAIGVPFFSGEGGGG